MSTMRAWAFQKSGLPANVLKLEESWPKPEPSGSKILVEVHAISLNPIGWKAMSQAPLSWGQKKPAVPEADVSGIVAGGELEGTPFKIGDEVFGIVPYDTIFKTGQGVLAEYTLVEPHLLAKKPAGLSHAEAASFPLAGLTAWQALFKQGQLKAGQRVFVNGGSGGVGAYAVQIAKSHGAFVVTTCSPSSASLVNSLGADEVIDYHSVDLAKHLGDKFGAKEERFDLVFDTIGVKSVYEGAEGFLKPTGTYLDVAGPHMDGTFLSVVSAVSTFAGRFLRPTFLGGKKVKYVFVMLKGLESGDALQEAANLFAKGTLKPIVDEIFPFEAALKAYERSMSGRAKGKVVISIS